MDYIFKELKIPLYMKPIILEEENWIVFRD